jgi:hypothetical protein
MNATDRLTLTGTDLRQSKAVKAGMKDSGSGQWFS